MNLALFDFDGTITTKATFPDFIRFAVAPARRFIGNLLFAPLVAGYKLGLVSSIDIRASVTKFAFHGVAAEDVRRAGHRFSQDVLPGLLRPLAMERIQWHKNQGDVVVSVSGAFDIYLSPWCEHHQLDFI
jgi:phosphatidylglycerophosphatase C